MLFQAVLGRSLETTVLVVLGWRVRPSADWIYYKCYSQDVMRDLNFKPATQHKLHFIVKPETFQLHLQHLQNIHLLHCTLLHLSGFTLPLNLLCASAFYRGKQQLHVRCLASKAPAVGENTEMHISWWPAWPQRSNSGFGACFSVYVGFCIQQKESGETLVCRTRTSVQPKACVKMLAASIINSAEGFSIPSLQKEWSDKTIHYIELGLKSSPARRLSQRTTSAELLSPGFSPKFTSKNILNQYTELRSQNKTGPVANSNTREIQNKSTQEGSFCKGDIFSSSRQTESVLILSLCILRACFPHS